MIASYLSKLVALGDPTAALVLRNGIRGVSEPLPAHLHRGPPKLCYQNATLDRPHLLYVEGYAVQPDLPIPFEHAWVYDPVDDKFYDPTWPEIGGECFGIAFRTEFFLAALHRYRLYGMFGVNARYLPSDPSEYIA